MRIKLVVFTLLAILSVPLVSISGGSLAARYNQGNTFYKEGKYDLAREEYLKAVKSGAEDPWLYFNLGNSELKSGHLGHAVAAYLKASILDPRDPDIRFNLEFARQRVKSKLPEDDKGIFIGSYLYVSNYLSANEWTGLAVLGFWISCLSIVSIIVISNKNIKNISNYSLYAGLGILILSIFFGVSRINRDIFTDHAVIISESIKARSGPGEDKPEVFELSEGTEVSLERCDSGWCRISARGGFVGWVDASSFQRL